MSQARPDSFRANPETRCLSSAMETFSSYDLIEPVRQELQNVTEPSRQRTCACLRRLCYGGLRVPLRVCATGKHWESAVSVKPVRSIDGNDKAELFA